MLIGLSRLSYRSLVAVAFFFPSALATAAILWRNSLPGCSAVPCYHPTYPSSATTLALLGLVGVTQLFNNTILPRLLYSKAQASTARSVVAFVSGLEFGLGLLISGMASPLKVLRFFAFAFDWSRFDPSLAMVIIFGIIPNLVANTLVLDFSHPPKLDSTWKLPETKLKDINGRFLLGSVAFGVAWGLSGVCPGPGILQAVLQPAWGVMWTAGFLLGSLF